MARVRAYRERTRPRGDDRLQHHRRDRCHAPPRRAGRAGGRLLRHGEPQLVRPVGHGEAAAHRRRSPIHGHRNGFGALSPASVCSAWRFEAYQALYRLAGVDHMHVHGIGGKFVGRRRRGRRPRRGAASRRSPTDAARTIASCRCSPPANGPARCRAPLEAAAAPDFLFLAGGGILAHPGGPAAGVRSLRAGLGGDRGRAIAGSMHAEGRPELGAALDFFGERLTVAQASRLRLHRRRLHRGLRHAGDARARRPGGRGSSSTPPAPDKLGGGLDAIGVATGLRAMRCRRTHPAALAAMGPTLKAFGAALLPLQGLLDLRQQPRGRQHRRGRRGLEDGARSGTRCGPRRPAEPRALLSSSATCSPARLTARCYRIDRHPVMARHPVTPMTEADLRLPPGGAGARPPAARRPAEPEVRAT